MTTMNNEDPADPSVHAPRELPEPAAWVRDLASPQPHCVTSLRYRSKSDADAGTWYAPLYTADQMREAIAAAERERDYLRWRLREIMPLFEEARDALCAISLVAAKAYRVDLSLGSRMDAAGTRTWEEFDAMLTAEGEITYWMPRQRRLIGSTG